MVDVDVDLRYHRPFRILVSLLSSLREERRSYDFSINSFFLEVGSENIMRKLKRDSVESLIKQEIAFFDHQDSSAGSLTSTVSSHPANVGAATGNVSAQMIIAGILCLGSVLLAFIIDWRIAVVCLPPTFVMAFAVGLLYVTCSSTLTCWLFAQGMAEYLHACALRGVYLDRCYQYCILCQRDD